MAIRELTVSKGMGSCESSVGLLGGKQSFNEGTGAKYMASSFTHENNLGIV